MSLLFQSDDQRYIVCNLRGENSVSLDKERAYGPVISFIKFKFSEIKRELFYLGVHTS